MKTIIFYISYVVLIGLFASSCGNSIDLPPLEETYSKKDKNPFGTYVSHHQLEQMYFHNTIRDIRTNFENTWREIEDTGAIYINISKNLFLSKNDLASMLDFVYNGNSMFISSDRIDKALLDTLGCTINRNYYEQVVSEMKYTSVKLKQGVFPDSSSYKYFYLPFYNHFSKLNSTESIVLGSNNFGPNCIVVFYGKGRFYLHTEPRAFSNYFLLQKDNFRYFRHLFSFTPAAPEHVYWDDYYNKRNYPPNTNGNKSKLSVLLKYPAMAWAFWILLLMLALYVFFGGKRRQRILATLQPNTNTTVAFTETIGRLYLQKKDNRNIADKLITYLFEHIRNQYYLNTSQLNDEFIATLSRKANVSKESVDRLFGLIRRVQQSPDVNDEDLLLLNRKIENFYKNRI